jgi:hypothetical protein
MPSIQCYSSLRNLVKIVHKYRDRVYIRKDVILKLPEYGELNQTKLMSYCGLNNVKHKAIVDEMVEMAEVFFGLCFYLINSIILGQFCR